nr:uncharacterized protein LOC109181252 [Ipomoea trifida]
MNFQTTIFYGTTKIVKEEIKEEELQTQQATVPIQGLEAKDCYTPERKKQKLLVRLEYGSRSRRDNLKRGCQEDFGGIGSERSSRDDAKKEKISRKRPRVAQLQRKPEDACREGLLSGDVKRRDGGLRLQFAPVASLVAAVRAEAAAKRKTDLAVMLAMVSRWSKTLDEHSSCNEQFQIMEQTLEVEGSGHVPKPVIMKHEDETISHLFLKYSMVSPVWATTVEIIRLVHVSLEVWQDVVARNISSNSGGIVKTRPEGSMSSPVLRCFVDAALSVDHGLVGFGALIMNNDDLYVAAKAWILNCSLDPYHAELMAIKEALSLLKEENWSNVIIFSEEYIVKQKDQLLIIMVKKT